MRPWESLTVIVLALAPALAAMPAAGQQGPLPDRAPAPPTRPSSGPVAEPEDPSAAAPVPEPRPAAALQPGKAEGGEAPGEAAPERADPEGARSQAVRGLFMPPAEILCRQRLRQAGAVFSEAPAPDPQNGCALPYPVALRGLPGGVTVEPEAVLNCTMAEAITEFARERMSPAADDVLASEIAAIGQASGYVCRPRNGTTKLSEHAFGNAIDIASFRLTDGRTITVAPDIGGESGTFVDKVRGDACGPFRTVLGPGSDADHASHLHLDLAPRRSRTPICQ